MGPKAPKTRPLAARARLRFIASPSYQNTFKRRVWQLTYILFHSQNYIMFFLFHSLSVEITQLILTQANFTNAKFDDPNLKLYLIEDIDTSKLQMQFNTIELIAELHGNNHTITHNDP